LRIIVSIRPRVVVIVPLICTVGWEIRIAAIVGGVLVASLALIGIVEIWVPIELKITWVKGK